MNSSSCQQQSPASSLVHVLCFNMAEGAKNKVNGKMFFGLQSSHNASMALANMFGEYSYMFIHINIPHYIYQI